MPYPLKRRKDIPKYIVEQLSETTLKMQSFL